MKKIIKKYLFLLTIALFAMACQEEEPQLGEAIDLTEIDALIENGDISVTQVSEIDPGGNTVVLAYDVPGTTALWDYGTGRSAKLRDTVRYAFKGEYLIRLFITSDGGVVEKQFPITVSDDNLTYVDHPLYDFLTGGGPGHSKTWVFDLRPEDALSTYFIGPLAFAGDEITYGYECTVEGGDCWSWQPNYQNWSMPQADMGSITFSLDGGPFVTVEQKEAGVDGVGTFNGTYFLDVNTQILTLTGVNTLNNGWTDVFFNEAIVVELSENGLALGFHNMAKPEYLVCNYVSKEYFDNWVPEEEEPSGPDEGFMPDFEPGELLEMLTGGKSSGRVWKLDGDGNPVDWLASGTGWTSGSGDSYDWGWNDNWTAAAENSWIRFDQFGGTLNYTLNQGGAMTASTFSIDEETNEITLGDSNTLITDGGNGSWMNPSTNVITVIKGFPDEYETKGIWFGTSYDTSKDEWFVFHYELP